MDIMKAIRQARQNGFTVHVDNYEIEIYAPGRSVGAIFNRNDPAQVREAIEYILSHAPSTDKE
jgi:hypothetical protein